MKSNEKEVIMKAKILIMEDDENINQLIKLHLQKEQYQVIQAFNGLEALEKFDETIDLAILDVMVPKKNGVEVLTEIREISTIPIIFLTAKDEDADKVLALGLGADDYVTKPFSVIELISRVKAHLRRSQQYLGTIKADAAALLTNGEIKMDLSTYKVYKDDQEVVVISKEFKLLQFFMENQGRVFTKKQLYENVWEEAYFGDDNTIMVHISRLREKLESNPKEPKLIKTIKGLGYRMEKL